MKSVSVNIPGRDAGTEPKKNETEMSPYSTRRAGNDNILISEIDE